MIFKKMHSYIRATVSLLQKFVTRLWYPPFIGLLAAVDHLVLVIPNDGILISSVLLTPRRWFVLGLSVTLGSTVGAMVLALLVQARGLPWILSYYPGIQDTDFWKMTLGFFEQYGLFAVFLIAATPLAQQPMVILASLANASLSKLAMVVFLGRLIKFMIMSYVASHAPHILNRMWGVQGELRDVGVRKD